MSMPPFVKVSTLIAAATFALSACQTNTAVKADPNKKPESISRHAVSPATTKSSTTPSPGGIEATRLSQHDASTDNPPGSTSTSGYTTTTMGRVSSHRVATTTPPPATTPATTTTTTPPATTTAAPKAPATTPGVVSNEPYFQDDKPAMKKK